MFAEENGLRGDPRLKAISDAIRVVPHFPKPGIMFQDISTLLLDHKAFKYAVDIFVDRYKDRKISVVAGVEARGFMFGPSIALAIGAKFVPLRKPGKLPGEVISEPYVLEYGTDCLEMHVGAVQPGESVVVVDDLVATGGTLLAAIRLLERVGAEVIECACVIGLPELKAEWDTTICPRGASSIDYATLDNLPGKRLWSSFRVPGWWHLPFHSNLHPSEPRVLSQDLGDKTLEFSVLIGLMEERHSSNTRNHEAFEAPTDILNTWPLALWFLALTK